MPDKLGPSGPSPADAAGLAADENKDNLRLLSRSPHPYHRQNFELLQPSDKLAGFRTTPSSSGHSSDTGRRTGAQLLSAPAYTKESTPASDSGTEADDEHFLKGLPAPKARLRKGIRGQNEQLSGSSTPHLSPLVLEDEILEITHRLRREPSAESERTHAERERLKKEIFQRATEGLILVALGALVYFNPGVRPVAKAWKKELLSLCALAVVLLALYPLRLIKRAYLRGTSSRWIPLAIPVSFDPAPILYPPVITIYVSLLTAANMPQAVLPNLILGICSIPRALVPTARTMEMHSPMHWLLSCLPLALCASSAGSTSAPSRLSDGMPKELLVLLYPLHQSLCFVLHSLTTTSLLPAELQLLSISLIDILLLSTSPQARILQALLWVGGFGVLISCGHVIRWGITLARVPKWRFRREAKPKRVSVYHTILSAFPLRKVKYDLLSSAEDSAGETVHTSDGEVASSPLPPGAAAFAHETEAGRGGEAGGPMKAVSSFSGLTGAQPRPPGTPNGKTHRRSHTSPNVGGIQKPKTRTPSGRRKRSSSSSVRAFFILTEPQALLRKWLYAAWVYAWILVVVLAGVRGYVGRAALRGEEPVGWALGYMLGDLPAFRFEVVKANLERWACLPPRLGPEEEASCALGWVQHLRRASLGEANTRLALGGYWLLVVVVGLAVVYRLTPVYEVDTRRKVFHFMMVAMFLPATFVDPAFAALALALVLAVFLLLDLLRASQLPPLSKPIARFLTPYIDGRDLRGPVVISHIFLLIGCAIPLWLSLASLPRAGAGGCLEGWEVPTRELSMVAGVVCVGLGDAAASLIGRRYGHHKWVWGGGKSLEGSAAFATAVFLGLLAANVWLYAGGWPVEAAAAAAHHQHQGVGVTELWEGLWRWDWARTVLDTSVCASMASLTEAVLTGGNDNVVVPVVLWTCVKSLGI